MAYTQADLDALNKAIATGVTEVEYRDRKVRYRSLEEMLRLRDLMKAEISPASGDRVQRAKFSRIYQ
jgi:hypothetical protein